MHVTFMTMSSVLQVQTEMLCSFARLDYWPGEELLSKCFDTLFQMLPKARKLLLPSSDVADCLWALAVLDAPPGLSVHLHAYAIYVRARLHEDF